MVLSIESIKSKCKEVFEAEGYIKKAYVFGSYARGDATNESDVDLLIVLDGYVGNKYFALYPLLEEALNKKVDVLTLGDAVRNPVLLQSINADKVIVYGDE